MENTLPQAIAPAELGPVKGTGATPCAQQTVGLTKQTSIEINWPAHYWPAHYERLVEREATLKADVEALQAPIRDLTQRLYGAKSEQAAGPDSAGAFQATSPRKRGQPPGSLGHGRSDRSALPVVADVHDVSEAAQPCPICGEALRPVPGAEESTSIEVPIQAPLRRRQRQRSPKTCQCAQGPGMVTAPPAPRLIPNSPVGVSVWTMVFLAKDLSGRPTHRFGAALRPYGLPLAQGTLTAGLHRIAGLFEPVGQAL